MAGTDRRHLGRVFNEVAKLYDCVRPTYPRELFEEMVARTGVGIGSVVLEVGAGTGQATRALAMLGGSVTAVEPGPDMAELARRSLAGRDNVTVETAKFEDWDDRGRRFDLLVSASAWHWVEPSVGWRRAHDLLRPGGWMALLGNVVVRREGEPEVYAETADLHEHYSPGNPDWGHPPPEDEVRKTASGWGPIEGPDHGLFTAPTVTWRPSVQWFDGAGFADLLRTQSIYRDLPPDTREPLIAAVADRIRTRMGDRVPRRYLTFLRMAQRKG